MKRYEESARKATLLGLHFAGLAIAEALLEKVKCKGPHTVMGSREKRRRPPPVFEQALLYQVFVSSAWSQSTINPVFEDRDGFLLFGGLDGLNECDGHPLIVSACSVADATSASDSRHFCHVHRATEEKDGWLQVDVCNRRICYGDPSQGTSRPVVS